ncbi:Gfo/Idh/MocA family protein, partial [Candidatus Hydrogenedentota bacterium]
MAERKVKWAVVGMGAGRGGSKRILEHPDCELVAVCDMNEERAKAAAEQLDVPYVLDYEELLQRDDFEVVYLVTPNGLHAEQGKLAAKYGKHVMITKPITITTQQANELIAACDEAGVKLMGQYSLRYGPNCHKVKRAVEKGKFGDLICASQSMKYFRPQSYYDGWHGTWGMGGGVTMTIPIHSIDFMQWVMGPVDTVYGIMGTYDRDMETENLTASILTFKNGAIGNIIATTTFPYNGPLRTEIHGTKGCVIYNSRGAQIEAWHGEEEATPTD